MKRETRSPCELRPWPPKLRRCSPLVPQGLNAAEYIQAVAIFRHFGKKTDKCETLMEKLTEACLSAEPSLSRSMLSSSTLRRRSIKKYGPAISSTTSPGRDTSARSGTAQHTSARLLRKLGGPAEQLMQPCHRGFSRDPLGILFQSSLALLPGHQSTRPRAR